MAGAIVSQTRGEYCDVQTYHFYNEWEELTGGNYGEMLYIKDVVNHNYQTLPTGETIAQYEEYVYNVHKRYLSMPKDGNDAHRWRGWDHWLDQHIGVKYAGSTMVVEQERQQQNSGDNDDDKDDGSSNSKESEHPSTDVGDAAGDIGPGGQSVNLATTLPVMHDIFDDGEDDSELELDAKCLEMAEEVTEVLLDEHLMVGKRSITTDGDHYYVGFEGNIMAVEFNTECHNALQGSTDICTCVETNSEEYAEANYNIKYSSCYELHEGSSYMEAHKSKR
jgi:hypothetical protein